MTTPGIDQGTVRLVAQRLNHYATPGPQMRCTAYKVAPDDGLIQSETCRASNENKV